MVKEIKYIGFYDPLNNGFSRVGTLAAINKMNYIADSIINAGYDINIISPSWISDSHSDSKFEKKSVSQIKPNKKVTLVSSWGTKNRISRNFKIVYSLVWLFFWLLKNVKSNEKILVYHSPWIALPIILAKKIKKFKLILEVEEIYADVSSIHPYFDKLESKILKKADCFLFSTDLLSKKIDNKGCFVVVYGDYKTHNTLQFPLEDGRIHLVYAGIIDSHKAGAFNAAELALHLSEKYVVHIIGFGEVELLKERIEQINKVSECKVIFDGSLKGDDYVRYCQKCHIGLSTQKMDGKYLETSFPSKILSYLGMGLRVVSSNIECVTLSKVGSIMHYYSEENPQAIAETIKNINISEDYNSIELLKELDLEFIGDLKKMLENEG